MKKFIAVVLIVLGLVAGAYSFDRFSSANESLSVSDEQSQEAKSEESAGNVERATELLEYAADNAKMANDARSTGYIAVVLGGILLIVGIGLLVKK